VSCSAGNQPGTSSKIKPHVMLACPKRVSLTGLALWRSCLCSQVGAISLGARLDCHAMANTHSSTSHYDPKRYARRAATPSRLHR
jgi:hypothetical protein